MRCATCNPRLGYQELVSRLPFNPTYNAALFQRWQAKKNPKIVASSRLCDKNNQGVYVGKSTCRSLWGSGLPTRWERKPRAYLVGFNPQAKYRKPSPPAEYLQIAKLLFVPVLPPTPVPIRTHKNSEACGESGAIHLRF